MKMVVGEYVKEYILDSLPPNPVSIHPEYFRREFKIVWCMQTLYKK
jgi:hypothetical protein